MNSVGLQVHAADIVLHTWVRDIFNMVLASDDLVAVAHLLLLTSTCFQL
jgi:hypothetical protein